jgi:protein-disulfide isomerase
MEKKMKKLVVASIAALALLAVGCQPPPAGNTADLEKRIAKLEKEVETLKKRPAAAPKRPERKPQTAAYKIPVGDSPVLGNKDAKISLTIFSDFQCPFCARVDPLLHDVVKDPELKDKVNVVFKHFPLSFHKEAKPASKAAMAAQEQGKFYEYGKKLLANQRALTPENFKKWAGEVGLDVAKWEADLKANDAKYEEMIKADMALGTKEARVRGTPTMLVGGWELRQRSVDGVKQLLKDKKML